MDNQVGPIDYGTTNMFVKQTVARARDAQSFGLMPYQRVILVLADRVEALEQIIAARSTLETRECRKCRAPLPDNWSFSFCNVCRDQA